MESEDSRSETEEISLDLSYSSSEFEYKSSDESESVSEKSKTSQLGVQPYQFEPYASDSDGELSDQDQENNEATISRTQNLEWCKCGGFCALMPSAVECTCCSENEHVQTKIAEFKNKFGKDINCITEHPGFNTVCLDTYVLEAAYGHYVQQYGQQIHNENVRSRYTSYRQCVRWIWGVLGKEIRVVIPSCTVKKIREGFPNPDQLYHGFEFAR